MLYRWLLDNRGKNILWNRNGEDRFQGFGLYKHITRHCTDVVPHTELSNNVFIVYKTSDTPSSGTLVYEFTTPPEEVLFVIKKKADQS